MSESWVNLTSGVPIVADFKSTRGGGSPICVNTATSTPYYLGAGDIVTAFAGGGGGGGSGTVTSVSVTTANGLSGTVATPTTTPALTLDIALVTGLAKGAMAPADFTKLSGIATGATANSTDVFLLSRANHTGLQTLDTTTDTATRLALTPAERTKLTNTTNTNSGDQTTVSGNAGSATILQTSRNFSIAGGGITAAVVGFTGAANVVLSASVDAGHITLARMANVATASFFGRITALAGVPEILSATQATSLLDAFTSLLKGLVPASGGGTVNYLRADGTFAAPPGTGGGSGTVTSVSVTTANGVSGVVATPTVTPAITLTLAAITPTTVTASGAVTGSNLSGTNTNDETYSTITTKLAGGSGGGTLNFLRADGTFAAPPAGGGVPTGRLINTTAPLAGGGDLSLDRTLSITAATTLLPGSMSAADKTKLDGVAAGATANSSDAFLLARANHTGTQAGSTVTGAFTASGLTLATSRLLGRTTAAVGAAEEISIGVGLTLTAGVLDRVTQTTVSGNAGTATALATPRNISITGKATAAGGTFDGSAVLAINITAVTLVAGDIPTIAQSQVTNLTTDLAAKSPIASPVFTGMIYFQQATQTALLATATLTIAQILVGIVTMTSASAVTLTLPTGTLTDAGILAGALASDRGFEWAVINLGNTAGAITMAAGATHTYVGNVTVAISTSTRFRTRKTAANTFITYRVA